jgi:hypothetical protein
MELQQDQWKLTDQDLVMLGIERLAYVKPVTIEGRSFYAVHAADGTEIAIIANRDVAFATVRQHDLEPVCVQ